MQIKNKLFIKILFFLTFILLNSNIYAEEFDISATEVKIDKKNNIVTGVGSVEVVDKDGRIIKADKVIYKRGKEFLSADGSVKITDINGNVINSDKATYDKLNEIITSYKNSNLFLETGYKIKSNSIIYNVDKRLINSALKTTFTDVDGNTVITDMFQYDLEKNLFSSVGKIKVTDINKNKYNFKEIHVDTNSKEMIASDVSLILDQENFGVSKKSDPRFVSNSVSVSENESSFTKGVFTVCKKRGEKCPPWSLQAKKITHNKIKKTIYYDSALLKVYGVPIFYFPKFYHPDPTVKRQSGFLSPFFTDSTTVGTGFGLPYFWAISNDRDLTFTPKLYANESMLLLNEYRQAFKNGFLTLDTSYTQGYKNTTTKKTKGSRNHIFALLEFNLGKNKPYESLFEIKTQRTSNDTYFRAHDINTGLVNSSNTNLINEINYNFKKDNMFLDIKAQAFEDLRKDSDKYEYIFPNITYGKNFFSEKFGFLDFKSNIFHRNYEGNKYTTFLNNDLLWSPGSFISKKGFLNTVEGMIKNTNYEAKNTTDLKTSGSVSELSSVISFKSSLPMEKGGDSFSKTFSPTFMVRYAPGQMKTRRDDDVFLNYSNLYSLNKTSEIETGLSTILGFDYKINEKKSDGTEREKFSSSMGQVFSQRKNKDLPLRSSLDQKVSDLVGNINYNFSEIGNVGYNFSLDNNYHDLNYNEISTGLDFGKISFNLSYLEQRNHVGNENYINSGITLAVNENSKLGFSTKKNFKTDSTEFYNINYQYEIDCLTAGLEFNREFYADKDIEQKDTLMFVIKFVPFTGASAPLIKP
jgi:LPS-assembly protein